MGHSSSAQFVYLDADWLVYLKLMSAYAVSRRWVTARWEIAMRRQVVIGKLRTCNKTL